MKKIISVAAVLFCAFATSFAQSTAPTTPTVTPAAQSETPTVVTNAFKEKFPAATDVKWEMRQSVCEADFKMNGKKYSSSFTHAGGWVETESPFTFDQLPSKVQNAFDASHKGEMVKEVGKIETSKGTTKYEVEVMQGVKTLELLYNSDGTKATE